MNNFLRIMHRFGKIIGRMILDRINISQRKATPEGFLVTSAIFGSVEILDYVWPEPSIKGFEAKLPECLKIPGKKIRVYRPESAIFDADTIRSFMNKPVTVEHKGGHVNSANYASVNVGITTNNIRREGDSLLGEIVIMDAVAISELQNGKSSISLGYSPEIDWTPGEHPKLGHYDGVQKNIIGNHVTLTESPRSLGAKVLDHKEITGMAKRKIFGIEIEVSDAVAEVFDSAFSQAEADDKKQTAELDTMRGQVAALEKKLAESANEIARVTDSAYIDAAARERANVIAVAKIRAPKLVCDAMPVAEIKRAVVVEGLGIALDAKTSNDYINGAFEMLCNSRVLQSVESTQVADALSHGAKENDTMESLHASFVARINKGDK